MYKKCKWIVETDETIKESMESFKNMRMILTDADVYPTPKRDNSLHKWDKKIIEKACVKFLYWSKEQCQLILCLALEKINTPPFNLGIGESYRLLAELIKRILIQYSSLPKEFSKLNIPPSLVDRLKGDCRAVAQYIKGATEIIDHTGEMWEDEDGEYTLSGIRDYIDFKTFQRVIDTQSYKKLKEDVLKIFNAALLEPTWLWKEMYGDLPSELRYFEELREGVSKYLKDTYSSTLEVDEYVLDQCKRFFSKY